MTDPVEKARRLQAAAQRRAADKRASLQAQRKRNREKYPELAEIIDALRERGMLASVTLTEKHNEEQA